MIAKKILDEGNALIIVKNEKIIYKSKNRGIQPMYDAVLTLGEKELSGTSVADKIIGKAAAILARSVNIKYLHANVISEGAIKILEDSDIEFEYTQKVAYIINRDKTDMCPVEKLSMDVESPEVLIPKIATFLDFVKNGGMNNEKKIRD